MNYRKRIIVMSLLDMIPVCTAVFAGWLIVEGRFNLFEKETIVMMLSLLISYRVFAFFHQLYNKAWSYASIGEMIALLKTVTSSIIAMAAAEFLLMQKVSWGVTIVTGMVLFFLIGAFRFSDRVLQDMELIQSKRKKRTLIIGAGSAGTLVVRQLLKDRHTDLAPAAFVDDDGRKHRLQVLGVPIVGSTSQIEEIVKDHKIEHIVVAIPSLNQTELKRLYRMCLRTNVKTQILPRIENLILGKGSTVSLEDIKPEHLLAREPVALNTEEIAGSLTNKTIMVTGAGGSIGSEICRQICQFKPERLLLLGHGENSIYTIEMELKETFKDIQFIPIIADIQDRSRIMSVMEKHRPSVVYHAAAHKHVPLMEMNPHEAVKNNVIGTKNVAEAAAAAEVDHFVMISSDKAVKPTSVMGATKRLAEMVVQHMNGSGKTKFVAVRFGNVLGSRGSVIPLFKKQIAKGGPVTVTHEEMVRYFMTIPEASRLVIQAGALANGGEVFVLDMGEPVKIVDLAKNLIQLSGYSLDEIEIEFTGMRPGEKMYEELLDADEVHEEQIYPKIYIGKANVQEINWVEYVISEFLRMEAEPLAKLLLDIAHHRMHNTKPIAANQ